MYGSSEDLGALCDGLIEITVKDVPSLEATASMLPALTPISIAYLSKEGGDARVRVPWIVRRLGFDPVPRISARRLASRGTGLFIGRLIGVSGDTRLFVVAGDSDRPVGSYDSALSLLEKDYLERAPINPCRYCGLPRGASAQGKAVAGHSSGRLNRTPK